MKFFNLFKRKTLEQRIDEVKQYCAEEKLSGKYANDVYLRIALIKFRWKDAAKYFARALMKDMMIYEL